MDPYYFSLGLLISINSILYYYQHQNSKQAVPAETRHAKTSDDTEANLDIQDDKAVSRFKWQFFPVYLLVVGSDWLQGPYIYALYKDEKALPEETVASLFMTGFVFGAASAFFVGSLADHYGRRAACLIFCAAYSVSCATVLSNNIILLFFGRALGGLSATLMYPVFETWMVTEYHVRGLDRAGLDLSGVFGKMTTWSSVVAIAMGVFSQVLVDVSGTTCAPFIASIMCLSVSAVVIGRTWNENYGNTDTGNISLNATSSGWKTIMKDKRILTLGATSAFFEGIMFIFIFYKTPALTAARSAAGKTGSPPFGLIFACLMCAMMSGSIMFTLAGSSSDIPSSGRTLSVVVAIASCCFSLPVLLRHELVVFWMFCLYEACIGVYYPSMGYLKGRVVEDSVRAKVYGVMRLPLNVFVIAALSLTQEGDRHRDNVFAFCGGLLLVVSILVYRFLG
ncbi:DUF791-domain-containing protein [Aulographum hederae CBS 113979]|uniref:Molybdate-anion transporter n=1 Tax=Aulographum hederae CBS 113979 TaxID=1176131 RepID=A0A6G1H5G5_9PEZI|nr:DUF791-domain-containing protein [Aulographum hederae CBS 113979]